MKKTIPSFLSIVTLSAGLFYYGINETVEVFSNFSIQTVCLISFLLILNIFTVAVRFKIFLDLAGCSVSFLAALKANLSGNFASIFLFPIFGQMAGRQFELKKYGVSTEITLGMILLERMLMFGLMLMTAILGVLYIGFENFSSFITLQPFEVLVIVILSGSLSLLFGRSKFDTEILQKVLSKKTLQYMIKLVSISLVSQAFIIATFVNGLAFLEPNSNIFLLIAGASIVSFAATLPISVNGWGIREVASVFVFGYLGFEPAVALALSVLIGLSSSAVVLISYPVISYINQNPKRFGQKTSNLNFSVGTVLNNNSVAQSIDLTMVWLLGSLCSILILFQIHFPVKNTVINVNLADGIAVLAFASVGAKLIFQKETPQWLISNFNIMLLLLSCLLFFAFINGASKIGITDWALTNRMFGWLVVLGYLFVGFLAKKSFGHSGVKRLIETMILTIVIIIISQILLRIIADIGFLPEKIQLTHNFEAFASNRNAFAFQILISMCLLISYFGGNKQKLFDKLPQNEVLKSVFFGILFAGLVFTASRAGYITACIILIFSFLSNPISRPLVCRGCLFGGLLLCLSYMLPYMLQIAFGDLATLKSTSLSFSSQESNIIRWQTILFGFELWKDSPILGSGLGVFHHFSAEQIGVKTVIHSTPIWILSEFGVFGAMFFLSLLIWSFIGFCQKKRQPSDYFLFKMLILNFLIFGMFHEIFYQRAFWFALGLCLAVTSFPRRQKNV